MREVPLRNRHGAVVAHAKVDDEDYERVMSRKWHVGTGGYARSGVYLGGGQKSPVYDQVLMSRFILGLNPGDPMVDHEDQNRLNNCRSNLRMTDAAGNAQNTCARPNRTNAAPRTSRFRNVMWYARYQKWRVLVTVGGKQHSGGYHEDEVVAALVAQRMRDELMPMAMPDPELAKLTTGVTT